MKETGEVLVEEIFSQGSQKSKRALLILSLLSFAITKGGLLPTSINALGIELSISNIKFILYLLIATMIYLLFSFCFSALSDYLKWKMLFYATIAYEYKERGTIGDEVNGRLNVPGHNHKIDNFLLKIKVNNWIRIFFEIVVTVMISLGTIVVIGISIRSI